MSTFDNNFENISVCCRHFGWCLFIESGSIS